MVAVVSCSLFVDVGNNYSVLDHPNICFVYDYVGSKDEEKSQGDFVVKELVAIFPVLRDWIAEFLQQNNYMVSSDIGHNMLIEQVLRLLYHLVKFGYYMDHEDVQQLLPPMLSLLDGRHDFPFPKDKDKGYSKDAMKQVLQFQLTDRYEKSTEMLAIVNAKFQALEVLDLLLTYQRNSRLQSFVGKFKVAEQSVALRKPASVLTPLLYDSFNPHNQTKAALRKQRVINKEMRDMFNLSAIFDIDLLTKILTDLSKYKYDKVITKSLNILNKVYSSKTNMFNLSFKAQILLTQDSARVHREVLKNMPVLRRLARAKLDNEQVKLMGSILDDLADVVYLFPDSHLPMTPDEPHPMNQNILISNGILTILFDILVQEVDIKLFEQYGGMTSVFRKTLYLLKLLARENEAVQMHIFERLDILLDVRVVESELAVALREVFYGNQNTCLKINPRQIQKIVNRAADLQEKGPEFLDLLSMIVKVAGTDLTLKRNQAYVMKYIMQNYKKVAFVLDLPREEREAILCQTEKMSRLRYISVSWTCWRHAKGENLFIESLCQTILPMEDLLTILNNPAIDNVLKSPLRCLHHVYMKSTGNVVDMQTSEIPHDTVSIEARGLFQFIHEVVCEHLRELWEYLSSLSIEINRLTDSIRDDPEKLGIHLKTAPEKSGSASAPDFESSTYGTVLYILEGVLPFLETFYRDFYLPDQHLHSNEADETDHLAKACVMFGEIAGPLLFKPQHMKNLVNCLAVIVPISNMPNSNLESVMERFASGITVEDTSSAIRRGNIEYYSAEVELNAKFRLYARNCAAVFAGHNTVLAQLKINNKRAYTVIDGDEELPLGEEFQSLVRCFVDTHEKKPEKRFCRRPNSSSSCPIHVDLLFLDQGGSLLHGGQRQDGAVDQLYQRKEISTNPARGEVERILGQQESEKHVYGHFDGSKGSQLSSNAHSFSLNLIVHFIGHKYYSLQQIQAYEDAMRQQRLSGWTRRTTKSCVKQPSKKKPRKQKELGTKSDKMALVIKDKNVKTRNKKSRENKEIALNRGGILKKDKEVTFINPKATENEALMQDAGEMDLTVKMEDQESDTIEADTSAFEYRNDGYIELVLKVMARMCDGQNKHLQDYLREQPDNVKSFDIIAEVTRFLNVVYSNINSKNIDLVIQLFETMNEFTAGNQENRVVIYDNKIIDYINFILRSGEFGDCSTEKTLELRKSISNLVMSLIEENGPGATEVALEVKDTLDKKAVLALMATCYERHQTDKTKIMELKALEEALADPLGSQAKMSSTRNLAKGTKLLKGVMKKQKEQFADEYMDVGFSLYLLLARMCDIDPKLHDYLRLTPLQAKAFSFYKKNCMSIEIVKDGDLQKINYRVKNRRVLREEVKEKLKWGVDRSSPSNKIRDLMGWTKDIMKDIAYQQKILKNPVAILLTKGWLVWNHCVTIISFAINILMLVTWEAKGSLETPGIMDNVTGIPPLLRDPSPSITTLSQENYNISILVLGGCHNFMSLLVFVSYFVCNHPRLPSIRNGINACKKLSLRRRQDDEEEEDKKRKHVSKLDARFFSVTTFYYIVFLAMSVGGTYSNGYFFAFHLLNIVNNNQLLSGVIKAVTQNGKSLLWVGVLGLVVFYLYGMVGFALMRSMFNPGEYLYCNTLWQCTITVIRYGLIGDLFEVMKPHSNEKTFEKFGIVVFYHVSFFIFITTIGLNIIFGIIVDTFSELRDLKWTAESDMRDTCFICSRNSYDFEHHGKGFDHHVRFEHNMWSYIFFFIHLNGTKVNDYTALEMYVFKLIKVDDVVEEFCDVKEKLLTSSAMTLTFNNAKNLDNWLGLIDLYLIPECNHIISKFGARTGIKTPFYPDTPPLPYRCKWQVESSPYVVVKMIKDASDVALPECAESPFVVSLTRKSVPLCQDTPMVVNTGGFTITYSTVPVTSDTWKGELEIFFLENSRNFYNQDFYSLQIRTFTAYKSGLLKLTNQDFYSLQNQEFYSSKNQHSYSLQIRTFTAYKIRTFTVYKSGLLQLTKSGLLQLTNQDFYSLQIRTFKAYKSGLLQLTKSGILQLKKSALLQFTNQDFYSIQNQDFYSLQIRTFTAYKIRTFTAYKSGLLQLTNQDFYSLQIRTFTAYKLGLLTPDKKPTTSHFFYLKKISLIPSVKVHFTDSPSCGPSVSENTRMLKDWTGELESPGYADERYPDNINCTWVIDVPTASNILLTFEFFSLRDSIGYTNKDDVCEDYVKVSGTQPLQQLFYKCGTANITMSVISDTGQMMVQFYSDISNYGIGFKASYKGLCRSIITQSAGDILTPNFPNSLPNDVIKCTWKVYGNQPYTLIKLLGVDGENGKLPDCGTSPVEVQLQNEPEQVFELCSTQPVLVQEGEILLHFNYIPMGSGHTFPWVGKIGIAYAQHKTHVNCSWLCSQSHCEFKVKEQFNFHCLCTERHLNLPCEEHGDLCLAEECNDSLCRKRIQQSTVFKTPNYPSPPLDNINCLWKLDRPNYFVLIKFGNESLRNIPECGQSPVKVSYMNYVNQRELCKSNPVFMFHGYVSLHYSYEVTGNRPKWIGKLTIDFVETPKYIRINSLPVLTEYIRINSLPVLTEYIRINSLPVLTEYIRINSLPVLTEYIRINSLPVLTEYIRINSLPVLTEYIRINSLPVLTEYIRINSLPVLTEYIRINSLPVLTEYIRINSLPVLTEYIRINSLPVLTEYIRINSLPVLTEYIRINSLPVLTEYIRINSLPVLTEYIRINSLPVLTEYIRINSLPVLTEYIRINSLPVLTEYIRINNLPVLTEYIRINSLPVLTEYIRINSLPVLTEYIRINSLPVLTEYIRINSLPVLTEYIRINSLPVLTEYIRINSLPVLTEYIRINSLPVLTEYIRINSLPVLTEYIRINSLPVLTEYIRINSLPVLTEYIRINSLLVLTEYIRINSLPVLTEYIRINSLPVLTDFSLSTTSLTDTKSH
ncbi:hypothetical protein Btru_007903 [Bulinus truncatus]|nr:hypothetical protein Btru_007903 [Bulinus truncatus]